jgi:hypothetical protein
MNNLEKVILYVLLVASVVLGIVGLANKNSLGAYIDSGQVSRFTDVNVTNDLVVDGILTAVTNTVSGTLTALTANITGANSTSTLRIGAIANKGCLELGDSASTTTLVYITATGSTVTATTTKPAACR